MAPRRGPDHASIARRIADYVVLAFAADAPQIAPDYWARSADSFRQMAAFAASCAAADDGSGGLYEALRRDPADQAAYWALGTALERVLRGSPALLSDARARIALADPRIWIDHHLGRSYQPDAMDTGLAWISALAPPRRRGDAPRDCDVTIIVPFRDTEHAHRLRNLIACLHALRDQDLAGQRFAVVVVETDTWARCRDLIEPLADRYLFAYKDGLFNKSWAVNLGLRADEAAANATHLTCVLDADILADRRFIARNAARFGDRDHSAHLAAHWSLSLDGPSTNRAIWQRVIERAAHADPGALRGLLLREPPGGCLWARTDLLHRIGGFDERFEGWGGEDDDVIGRLSLLAPLPRFGDTLLHLDHPRPLMTNQDGMAMNGHLIGQHLGPDLWTASCGFGDPSSFLPAAANPAS